MVELVWVDLEGEVVVVRCDDDWIGRGLCAARVFDTCNRLTGCLHFLPVEAV
jgi:hypothetical protein